MSRLLLPRRCLVFKEGQFFLIDLDSGAAEIVVGDKNKKYDHIYEFRVIEQRVTCIFRGIIFGHGDRFEQSRQYYFNRIQTFI